MDFVLLFYRFICRSCVFEIIRLNCVFAQFFEGW